MAEVTLPKIESNSEETIGELIKKQDITNTTLLSIKETLEKSFDIQTKSVDDNKKERRSFMQRVTGFLFKQKEKESEASRLTPVDKEGNAKEPRTKLSDAFKADTGFLSKILGPIAAGALAYFIMNPDSIMKVFNFIKGVVDWFSGTSDIVTGLGETADSIMNSALVKSLAATAAGLTASLVLFPRTTIGLFKATNSAIKSSIAATKAATAKTKDAAKAANKTFNNIKTKVTPTPKTVTPKATTTTVTPTPKTVTTQVPANENVKPAQSAKPTMTKSGYKVGEVFETKSGGKMKVMQNAKTGAIYTQGVAKSTKVGMQKVNPLTKFPKFAKVLSVGKRIPILGTVLGTAEILSILASDASPKEKTSAVAGALGGIGGSALGGMLGGTLGTAIFPGVGTVIGGALGGLGGYFLAGSVSKALAQWMLGQKVDAFPLDYLNDLMNGDEKPQTGTGTGEGPASQVSKKEIKPSAATKEQPEQISGKTELPKKLSDLMIDGRKYDPEMPGHQLRARTLGYNPETGLHSSVESEQKDKVSMQGPANQNIDGFKADGMSRQQNQPNVTIIDAPTNNVSAPQNNSTNINSSGGSSAAPIAPKNTDYSLSAVI